MKQSIQPLSPQSVLPPLLACLPTAFTSFRPPPALLPLLSPILRQRVILLSDPSLPSKSNIPATASSTSDERQSNIHQQQQQQQQTWLPLLTWNLASSATTQLINTVSHNQQSILRLLEPHPVSGEVELDEGEIGSVRYRRLDVETLHARLDLENLGLRVIYLWCYGGQKELGAVTGDENQLDGWQVTELVALVEEEKRCDAEWSESIAGADERFGRIKDEDNRKITAAGHDGSSSITITTKDGRDNDDDDEDDDDAYWAAYDQTPGPTPTRTSPPPLGGLGTGTRMRSNTAIYTNTNNNPQNPGTNSTSNSKPYNTHPAIGDLKSSSPISKTDSYTASLANSRNISASELAYFARYESEVQPAMDGHDPEEERGASTRFNRSESSMTENSRARTLVESTPYADSNHNAVASNIHRTTVIRDPNPDLNLIHPQPQPYISNPLDPLNPNLNPLSPSSNPDPNFSPNSTSKSTSECYASLASHQLRAETAVRQHIATNVKSMYRLAGSVGVGRAEFERLVTTEVELLGVAEGEDD